MAPAAPGGGSPWQRVKPSGWGGGLQPRG